MERMGTACFDMSQLQQWVVDCIETGEYVLPPTVPMDEHNCYRERIDAYAGAGHVRADGLFRRQL